MQSNKTLIPTLLAVGGTLVATPATAIELGEINVESTLGQPLRASIAYALTPNEQLSDYCVTLHQGPSASGLPAIQNGTISIAGGIIALTGREIVREPLMSVRVNIACPYTPKLSREYMLFIDPEVPTATEVNSTPVHAAPAPAVRPVESPAARPVETPPVRSVEASAARPAEAPAARPTPARPSVARAPIAAETRYQVRPGDSLSVIASRIENRPIGLWNAVTMIFEANPEAFIDNDPNKLMAGAWLAIPDFGGGAAVVAETTARSATAPVATVAAENVASPVTQSATVDDTAAPVPAPATESVVSPELEAEARLLDRENPFVDVVDPVPAVAEPNVLITDTPIDVATESASPNVPVARIAEEPTARPAAEKKSSWLLWMIGGGIALLAGLLLFGRRRRFDESDPYAEAEAEHPMRRSSDSVTVETLAAPVCDLDDDSPTAENLSLDADLAMGTGLDGGTDVEVRQDFGFAATTDLDFDLTSVDEDEEPAVTDRIPVPTIEDSTILEQEILPGDADYDMSVIVDATKMSLPDEVTERDLKAFAAEDDDHAGADYTVDQEIDFQILEQDYEDELTATQALNKEIEKAAAGLIDRGNLPSDYDDIDDETSVMPLATVTEIDATSRLPVDQISTTSADDTIAEEATMDLNSESKTVRMPKSDNDDTVEMPANSDKVDTKAG